MTEMSDFRRQLEEEYQTANNPKATALWELAWEKGHAYGQEEVRSEYRSLLPLVARVTRAREVVAERVEEMAQTWEGEHGFDKHGVAHWMRAYKSYVSLLTSDVEDDRQKGAHP